MSTAIGSAVGAPGAGPACRDARRIPGYEPLVSSTIRGGTALGIGLFLVSLCVGAAWVAFGDLPAGVERPNVSPAVFMTVVGGIFGMPGLYLIGQGLVDRRGEARRRRARASRPDEPWLWDHAWHVDGAADLSLRQAVSGALGLGLAVAILVPLHLVFLGEEGPRDALLPTFVLGLFDLLVAISFLTVVHRLAYRFVRGAAHVRFGRFPFRLGERATLRLEPHAAWSRAQDVVAVLRCVEETCEARRGANGPGGDGPTTQVSKVGLEHCRLEQRLPEAALRSGHGVELVFDLPDDACLGTRLGDRPSWHWELTILTGPEGARRERARFLVPVY
ncbi:MAG: hypothetical protein H6748_14430 [Spirochaetaceae bacterium]|nr:hypothetical protein [Myxococcales bacterium]MCB9725245.1 hypothetical protein [Spirochaetaceae bacterium]